MAVKTKHTFPAANGSTAAFSGHGIELNNLDDLDVYVTLSGGTRRLSLRQSTDTTATSSHPQVNNTDGLYFPAVSVGDQLYNYQLSTANDTITFNNNLPNLAVVTVERRTRDASSAYTTFAGGSTVRHTDLNRSATESNYTAQEGRNKAFELEGRIFGGESTSTSFITSDEIVDGTIVDADINASAQIAVNKLADGSARQVLQTASNGSDVEWTSNVDLSGTLDVAGNSTLATVDINGGNIDGTAIGASSSATARFTTLNTTGLADLQILEVDTTATIYGNTTIGGTLGVTGALDANGGASIDNVQIGVSGDNEIDTASGNLTIDSAGGTVTIDDNLTVTGNISASGTNNANTLDSLDSTQFLRSDATDTFTGTELIIADNKHLQIGTTSGGFSLHRDTTGGSGMFMTTSVPVYYAGTSGSTFRTGANHKDVVKFVNTGSGGSARCHVELYEGADGLGSPTKRLETTSTGVTITGETKTTTLEIGGDDVTSTAIELNILDGVTATTTELNKLDGYTGTAADLNEVVTGKSVVEQISTTATDAQIPTAQAVNERITTVVSDVGGFVPIANETSFPTANPDLDNAAGTIVSVKALTNPFTTGSGVTTKTITNGAGSGKNVTITGLTQSTTYPAGRGMLLETTQYSGGGRGGDDNEYEYAFHRLTLDETGVAAAQAAIDDWDERYYGPLGSAPNTRPGGGSRVQGDLYFSTSDNQMKVWNNAASQWDDVASSASSNIVTLSPAFDNSETEFTCSTVPVDAQSLLLSVNGIIQKPNSGTSTPSEGFVKLANGKIKLATAPASGAPYFAISLGNTVSVGTPSPNTVGTTELKDNEVTEVKLDVHNAPSGTDKFLAYTSNGMEWAVPTDTNTQRAFANDANNRVVTGDGSGGLNGEANLTFDGTLLKLQCDSGEFRVEAANGVDAFSVDSDNGNTIVGGILTLSKTNAEIHLMGSGTCDHSISSPSSTNDLVITANKDAENVTSNIVFKSSGTGGGAVSEKLRIDSSGNAKFSTNQVHLYNSVDLSNTYFYAQNTGGGNAGIKMKNVNGEWTIVANDRLRFIDDDAGEERLSITSGGKVGIGITSPGSLISAKGNETAYAGNDAVGAVLTLEDSVGRKVQLIAPGSVGDGAVGTVSNNHFNLITGNATKATVNHTTGNFEITDGDLKVASGHGINFSATSDAAGMSNELLEDYEEGSWTPVLQYLDTNNTWQNCVFDNNLDYANGSYVKVGNIVHGWYYTGFCTIASAANNRNATIHGLPYAFKNGEPYYGGTFVFTHCNLFGNGSSAQTVSTGYANYAQSYIIPMRDDGSDNVNGASWNTAGHYFMVSFTYQTD